MVTLVGTLPPIKGISPYCAEYALKLADIAEVDFINFKRLYPERLYPGGTSCDDLYPISLSHPNLKVRNLLTWYNPISWIRAGFSAKGDIVHVQWWSYPLAPIFVVLMSICKLRRKKVLITVHNVRPHEGGFIRDFLNSLVFPFADRFMVHSEKNRRELAELGFDRDRILVLPHHAIRRSRLGGERTNLPSKEARLKSGIPLNAKVLCFFGNIRPYKGLDVLLHALELVREHVPEVLLIIAGQPWEPWEKYDRIIKKKNLEKNLMLKTYFLPFCELEMLLKASDLAVFPFKELHSTSDSVSLALALGCKVLCTRHLDLPYEDDILFIPDSDQEVLAERIIAYFRDHEGCRTLDSMEKSASKPGADLELSLARAYDIGN